MWEVQREVMAKGGHPDGMRLDMVEGPAGWPLLYCTQYSEGLPTGSLEVHTRGTQAIGQRRTPIVPQFIRYCIVAHVGGGSIGVCQGLCVSTHPGLCAKRGEAGSGQPALSTRMLLTPANRVVSKTVYYILWGCGVCASCRPQLLVPILVLGDLL